MFTREQLTKLRFVHGIVHYEDLDSEAKLSRIFLGLTQGVGLSAEEVALGLDCLPEHVTAWCEGKGFPERELWRNQLRRKVGSFVNHLLEAEQAA